MTDPQSWPYLVIILKYFLLSLTIQLLKISVTMECINLWMRTATGIFPYIFNCGWFWIDVHFGIVYTNVPKNFAQFTSIFCIPNVINVNPKYFWNSFFISKYSEKIFLVLIIGHLKMKSQNTFVFLKTDA